MPGDKSGVRGAESASVVLVVDDDEALRSVVVRGLEHWGHACASVESAEAALVFCDPGAIALLITDLHLPTISGVDLIERMRQRSHLLPAILMSGNMTAEARQRAHLLGGVELLEKPFGMSYLHDVLRRMGCLPGAPRVG